MTRRKHTGLLRKVMLLCHDLKKQMTTTTRYVRLRLKIESKSIRAARRDKKTILKMGILKAEARAEGHRRKIWFIIK